MTEYILGGVIAAGFTVFCAWSNAQAKEKKMNEALTISRDGAQRNPDIHWPEGQHPEDADLYAHNEIMVNASCETVFANIVDAHRGRAGIPTLTMSSFMTARTMNCTKGRSSPGTRSVYTSRAPFTNSCPIAELAGGVWARE